MDDKTARLVRKINGDVARVRKDAKLIFELEGNRCRLVSVNKNGRINVVAVLGEARIQRITFSKALLCEVGLGKGRPYRFGGRGSLRPRAKLFHLTDEQYKIVAPEIFGVLHLLAAQRVARWKNLFFSQKTLRFHFSKRKNRVFVFDRSRLLRRGVRFSVSLDDVRFAQDAFAGELLLNKDFDRWMTSLAKYIHLRLCREREKGYIDSLVHTNAGRDIVRCLARFSRHTQYEVMRRLPQTLADKPWNKCIKQLMSLNGHESAEMELARSALPGVSQRLAGFKLCYVRLMGRCVSFELIPNTQLIETFSPVSYVEEDKVEVEATG